jgi:hypothetical protein
MKVSLRFDHAAAQAQLRQITEDFRRKARQAAAKALDREAPKIEQDVRAQVAGALTVVKKPFLKSFKAKVLTQDPARWPGLYVGSRIPWSGLHEQGGSIHAKMLIPLHGRVGRKRFKAQVTALIRGGNAYFVKGKSGRIVLMAENIKDHDKVLAGFKKKHRLASGIKRLKRGADIPIAVLVNTVKLKKRLDVEGVVKRHVPQMAAALEAEFKKVG